MAIGANELAMSDLSEFGPLDIQVRRNDEFYEHSSGLDLVESMNWGGVRNLDLMILS